MDVSVKDRIDRREWMRALGSEGAEGAERDDILRMLDEVETEILSAARPRAAYRVMEPGELTLEGRSIERHLEGCDRIAVMGATLGAGVDELIRRLQVRDMTAAVAADCGASVLTEQVCDSFCLYIAQRTEGYVTSRFSPGYGDLPLHLQEDIVRCIDGRRKIGLNVTSDSLLVPRKSVTAIMGISDLPVSGSTATCDECVLREKCEIRRKGRYCGDRSE